MCNKFCLNLTVFSVSLTLRLCFASIFFDEEPALVGWGPFFCIKEPSPLLRGVSMREETIVVKPFFYKVRCEYSYIATLLTAVLA